MRFCIVGTGRCGTTLLRNMLNESPDVFVFPETHWIPKMYEFFGDRPATPEALIDIVQRTFHVTGEPVTTLDVPRLERRFGAGETVTVSEFCDRLGLMFASEHGKASWADKTPDYGPYLSTLQALWPNCRFVHLIRHGADVACSMKTHPGYRWLASAGEVWWCPASFNGYYSGISIGSPPIADYLRLWRRRLNRIQDELSRLRAGTFLEIRFEDLIEQPRAVFEDLCRFLLLGDDERDWVGRAVAQVDPNRVRSRASEREFRALRDPELSLLGRLGYDLRR